MPETTSTDCSDLDQNEPSILVPSTSTVDITMMLGKVTLSNSNGEESDASSDGGGEAIGTAQPLNSGASYTIEIKHHNQSPSVDSNSSVVSDGSWTNSDRDQERQRRSRSSSECSDSSSVSSDSLPPEVCVVKCNGRNKGLANMLNNFNKLRLNVSRQNVADTTERDVDSNEAKETTNDLDYESSSDDNQDSEDEAGANDTNEQYTQRGPVAAKGSPPHAIKPYDSRRDQNWNYAVRNTGDRYSQKSEDTESDNLPEFIQRGPMKGASTSRAHNGKPYNLPDSSLGSSPTGDEVEPSTETLALLDEMWKKDPEGMEMAMSIVLGEQENLLRPSSSDEQTTFNGVQAPPCFVIDVSPNDLPMSPSPTHQQEYYMMRQNSSSIGSTSPTSSLYNSQTPSPTTYINGPAAGVEEITGSFNGLNPMYSGSPLSDSTPECTIAFNRPRQYFMDSVHQSHQYTRDPGTTTSTIVVNSTGAGLVTVNTQPTDVQHSMATAGNNDYAEPQYWEREGILNMHQFEPEPVIPTTVRDIDNTRDDPVEYANLLRSLDTELSRSANTFMQLVPLASLRSNVLELLDRKDEEFFATNDHGNTYAMVVLSRSEHVILPRLARLLVTLEKMHRVPASYEAMNIFNHDLLYMAAINFGGRHQFITGIVLEKTFKAVGADSEIWTRTYDHLGNTLIHIVIAKGPEYANVLRELLDVKTTGNRTVFNLTVANEEGKTPYDLAVAVDNARNDNYPEITRILANYDAVGNLMGNAAPNVPFTR